MRAGLVVVGVLAASGTAARAGYTAVAQPRRAAELSHEQILEHVYGGDFVSDATGVGFANGSGITVTRLEDGVGPGTDADWTGKTLSARTVAAFSGNHKTARYFGATSGGQSKRIFDTSGRQFDATGSGTAGTPVDGELFFTKGRGRGAKVFSSAMTSNRDGMDHLVTYEVNGTAQPASVYLLCWEDKFAKRSDRDYNDLVVEVQAAEIAARAPFTQPLLIPLPPPAWTGLAGLLGLASISSWRRRRPR